jgi:hypothetical protein
VLIKVMADVQEAVLGHDVQEHKHVQTHTNGMKQKICVWSKVINTTTICGGYGRLVGTKGRQLARNYQV